MTYTELEQKLELINIELTRMKYSADKLRELLPGFGITDTAPVEDLQRILNFLHGKTVEIFNEEAHKILTESQKEEQPNAL